MDIKPTYIYLEETDSTNSYLAQLLVSQPETPVYTVVYAGYQRAGRGQRGHHWESQRGKNLLFSILLRPRAIKAGNSFAIQQIVSLSILKILSQYTTGLTIKWPNDIYWNDKKICGFITENTMTGEHIDTSVVGIGINLNQRTFVSRAPNPVSLWQIINKESSIQEIMEQITTEVMTRIARYDAGHHTEINREYLNVMYRGKGFYPYTSKGRDFKAMICAVTPQGELILCEEDGTITKYMFKEVTYKI